jgi:thioredoxin-dependent peroxiredoxin
MTADLSAIGLTVPDFSLPGTGGEFRLSAFRGKPLVIYFYPKDSTPGCTTEAGQFRDLHDEFEKLGCSILGVSRDSLKSHHGFKAKLGLPFELLSDTDETACRLFDVIRMKRLYGKETLGIQRSTFLIDRAGVLRREWRTVKADGHAAEVLAAARLLQ